LTAFRRPAYTGVGERRSKLQVDAPDGPAGATAVSNRPTLVGACPHE